MTRRTTPLDVQTREHARLGCSCFVLRRLSRTVSRLYDQHLADVGLKTTQYSLLNTLARAPAAVSQLAEVLGLERTTLSRNIRPLIARGLIEIAHHADARRKMLCITAAGGRTLSEGRKAWRLAQDQLEETLGSDFVRELHGEISFAQKHLDQISHRALS
jgi:DNA-binding MarR family transcriptional regulator